ncbi:MAG: HAD family hydrolase [Bacteroidota bacterium]
MGKNLILLIDLDDTLFETKTMGVDPFKELFESFQKDVSTQFDNEKVSEIFKDIWKLPFDQLARKYRFSSSLIQSFMEQINNYEFELRIEPYHDYSVIQNFDARKILVTTGFQKLQLAKIKALGIHDDFDEVHIDAIDQIPRIDKKMIFKEMASKHQIPKDQFIVLGDNPNSELKAGHELGFTTIQVRKHGQERTSFAQHCIEHFEEVHSILL